MGYYYYYLLFVDGYSKSSVRSPLRQGSLGEMALEILSLVPRATWELRVIKVHFAIAICSAGCLTLHLSSGCRCPCSTGDRESNKLQRGTLGIGKEEPTGRGMLTVSWKEHFIALFGLLLFCPALLHKGQTQGEQMMKELPNCPVNGNRERQGHLHYIIV